MVIVTLSTMGVTIKPIINYRNKTNKTGRYPIHLRVTVDRDQRYYQIKVPEKVALDQWSGEDDNWVRNSHTYSFEINNKIIEKKKLVIDLVKRFYNSNKQVTFYAIDRELNRKGDRMVVNDYMRNYIRNPPENVKLDDITWEKYAACLKHLDKFQPKILFAEVDDILIARFRNYLADHKGQKGKMQPSTIKSYFDKIKVVLMHAAKKENFLNVRELESFFEDVKISVPKKKEGLHLEIEELQRLRKLIFTEREYSLERDRDLFLFQVYTGFYYNDLQILRKDQLFKDVEHGHYIIGERDKNGNPTIIPLYKFPYANAILEKYGSKLPDNPLLFKKSVFIEIQVYNRNLKILAKKAEIFRPLTNKTGRHTNAQMWIRFGAERPVLSKMMGHEKEQTTENYYKVGLREVIEGTKGVDFERFGF
jgi:integrase